MLSKSSIAELTIVALDLVERLIPSERGRALDRTP